MADSFENRYSLVEEIGRGGGAIVYRAQDTLLDRHVAIKVLHASGLGTEGKVRLLEEAKAVAKLNHPNIVTVYDAGERQGSPYIVMELVEGPSLHNARPTELSEIVAIARQICTALDHAHQHGMVHRDLKPENVLLGDDGKAKLVDFGLARSFASRVTSEGNIAGTVFYLSPEQAMGQQVDGRADLYSLGVMLYELVTGRLPFEADRPLAVISQHLHAPVVPPSTYKDDIPKNLERLILKLLEKHPDNRPASAKESERALAEWQEEIPESEVEIELSLLDRIARGRLVGRDHELAELEAYWNRALTSEGRVAFISGEPGIGKTRLTREFLDRARVARYPVLQGECYAEGGASYTPIVHLLRQALDEGFIQIQDIPPYIAADLIALAPELRHRFPEMPPNPTLQADAEKQRIFESFVSFCRMLWENSGLLIFIDDVHWSDSGSLSLLRHLARRARTQPLFILLTYREVELNESLPLQEFLHDLNRERLAVRIKLGRLTRDKTRKMLEAMFGEDISDEFLDGIYLETEGNPFFIEEVCKALVEQGSLSFKEGRWDRPSMEDLQIPQSVRVAIQSRLGKLPEQAQRALEIGAVIGNEFEYDLLLAASEMEETTLIEALEKAQRGQLIREVRSNGAVNFAFMHALIPTTLRESVSGLRRRTYHEKVALVLEAKRPGDYERLAYHHEHAGHPTRSRTYYLQAGERAWETYAPEDALRFYQRSLVRWPEDDPVGRAEILVRISNCLTSLGDLDGAWQGLENACELFEQAGAEIQLGDTLRGMSRLAWTMGDRQRSLEHAYKSRDVLEQWEASPELAESYEIIGRLHMLASDYDQAIEWCERAIRLADTLQVLDVRANALNTMGVAKIQLGQSEEGFAGLREALTLAMEHGFVGDALRTYHNLCELLVSNEKYDEARQTLDDYRNHAIQLHDHISEPIALMNLIRLDWRTGHWRNALLHLERMVDLPEGVWNVWSLTLRAAIDNDLGIHNRAVDTLEMGWEAALASNEAQTTVPYLGEFARALAGQSQHDRAAGMIGRFLEMVDRTPYYEPGSLLPILFACRWLAQHAVEDSPSSSYRCLERLAKAKDQLGNLGAQAVHAEASGVIALKEQRHEAACAHLRDAIKHWQSLGHPYEELRALHDLQHILIVQQKQKAAQDVRGQALEIIERLATQIDNTDLCKAWWTSPLVKSFQKGDLTSNSRSSS
jgi:tetratricopeptide (TPR) repeat protein